MIQKNNTTFQTCEGSSFMVRLLSLCASMDFPIPVKCRFFGAVMFFIMFKDCCCLIKYDFGHSGQIKCDLRTRVSSWYHNGVKLQETSKIKFSGESLYIFCLEPSDSGTYRCEDNNNVSMVYNFTVRNPENKHFIILYNKNRNQCLLSFNTHFLFGKCVLNDCRRKWSWDNQHKLVSASDPKRCISVNNLSSGTPVSLDNCTSSLSKKWQCEDNDLLRIEGTNFFFSNKKDTEDVIISSVNERPSGWLNYFTGDNLCVSNRKGRKVIVYPNHLVLSVRRTASITCMAFNFINPTYMWMNNGKDITRQSDIHIHINPEIPNVLNIPFAYLSSTGGYTCVVRDRLETVNATARIEVYEDPSVIRHFLKQAVNIGVDVCLSCQFYTTNNSHEVSWYKDGNLITQEIPKYNITHEQGRFHKFWSHLCITSVRSSDRGQYSCGISGLRRAKGDIIVLVKPEVKIDKDGDQLNCSVVSGIPPPRVVWFKDNQPMKNNGGNIITMKESAGNYTCLASNIAGTSVDSYISKVAVPSEKSSLTAVIIGCVVAAIIFIIILIVLICCYCRRKKQPFHNEEDNYQVVRYTAAPGAISEDRQERPERTRIEFHQPSNTAPGQQKGFSFKSKIYSNMKPRNKTEWEIPPECIKCQKKLGEGQFGQVWQGEILSRKGSRIVAIKMLKENAGMKERKSLIDELDFMKTMTAHPNIVGLIGCCTRSDPIMIVVEFVPHGDLKSYLIQSRGQSKDTYANLAPYSTNLSSKDLMSFAYQIARGMSYLEKIKCVHRDLAARNILIGDNKTCKIADFGLARDIYCENYYRKTNGGRLPLRWMAYESIFNGITTNQSDAWSFGIVLWEIITLGGNPYPEMTRDDLIEALQRGYRMPKPNHCSDELYSIMWDCWQQNPDKRPTFAELTASFLRLISLQQLFINMEKFGEDDYVNVGSYEMN